MNRLFVVVLLLLAACSSNAKPTAEIANGVVGFDFNVVLPDGKPIPWDNFFDIEVSPDCRVVASIARGLKNGNEWDYEKSWLLVTYLDETFHFGENDVDSYPGIWTSPAFSPDSTQLIAIKNADTDIAQVELINLSNKESHILVNSRGWEAIRRAIWLSTEVIALEVTEDGAIRYFAVRTDGDVDAFLSMPQGFEHDTFTLTHTCGQDQN